MCAQLSGIVYYVRRELHYADTITAPQAAPDALGGLSGYGNAVAFGFIDPDASRTRVTFRGVSS